MKIIRFDIDMRFVDVAAESVQEALALLCRYDYFDGVDDQGDIDWFVREDHELLSIHMEDDPDEEERAMPDAQWVEDTRTMTASAGSWAATCHEPCVVGDSES